MAQKHVWSKKNFPFVTRRCTQICVKPSASPSKARKLNFWLPAFLGQFDTLHILRTSINYFFRVAAIQILDFQRIYHAHKILHASIQYVLCKKNLINMEAKQYEGSYTRRISVSDFYHQYEISDR
jgi:hypothetical protein